MNNPIKNYPKDVVVIDLKETGENLAEHGISLSDYIEKRVNKQRKTQAKTITDLANDIYIEFVNVKALNYSPDDISESNRGEYLTEATRELAIRRQYSDASKFRPSGHDYLSVARKEYKGSFDGIEAEILLNTIEHFLCHGEELSLKEEVRLISNLALTAHVGIVMRRGQTK